MNRSNGRPFLSHKDLPWLIQSNSSFSTFATQRTDCLSGYNPKLGQYRRGYRYYFHGESCLQMPGSALVAVGAGAAVITFLAGLLVSLRDTVTGTYLAPTLISTSQADSAVRIHIAKTVVAIFAMNLKGEKQLQAIIMLIAYWYMLWCVFRRLPHVRPAANLIRGASFGMLAWTSLMLLLRVYNVGGKDGKSLSTVRSKDVEAEG